MRALIATLRGEGLTVVLIEQRMDAAMGLADRAVALDRGMVIASGTPERVRRDPTGDRRLSPRGRRGVEPLTTAGLRRIRCYGSRYSAAALSDKTCRATSSASLSVSPPRSTSQPSASPRAARPQSADSA